MVMAFKDEIYIPAEAGTAGPNPEYYSLLSIGACRWILKFYFECMTDIA